MRQVWKKAGVILFWLLVWEGAHHIVGRELVLPSPRTVATALAGMAVGGGFWLSVGASLGRIAVGYLAALAAGSVLGVATAAVKPLDALLSPIGKVIRATPVASFILLLFVFFQKKHIPIATSLLMVLPIVWSNVYEGVKSTDPKLLEMARVFQLGRRKTLRRIYLPSVMPYFMAAAKAGMGLSWKAGIAAEVLASPALGIGSGLYESKIYLDTPALFAWTAVVVCISVVLESAFVALLRRAFHADQRSQ